MQVTTYGCKSLIPDCAAAGAAALIDRQPDHKIALDGASRAWREAGGLVHAGIYP